MPEIAPDIARAKQVPRSRRMPMLEGFLYEPRAFWSVGRMPDESDVNPPTVVLLDREHFYNGEKYPITLLYACVAPVGYLFDRFAAPAPFTTANFRNCGAAQLAWTQLRIAARQRQHYVKIAMGTQGLIPRPAWEPRVDAVGDDAGQLYNTYRWAFDAPMIIPVRGDLQYDLATWLAANAPFNQIDPFRAQIGFQEIGNGPFGSAARVSDKFLVTSATNNLSWIAQFWGADGFGSGGGQTPNLWPPNQSFRARDFAQQNKSSDGSIPITSVNVSIDQRAYDADLIATAIAAGATTTDVASMGMRLPTRARMRHGGTGAWWWREGAPLALVSPHRTPAQVFDFRCPLTLGPGDSLEVELTFPFPPTVGEDQLFSINQLGVSFCGYAAIES